MEIILCAICNISSGNCPEDCKYCTQSKFVKTDIQRYHKKEISQIIYEAKIAKKNKALGFCLVTSGLGESEKDRVSFRKSLQELKPFSSPINFFIANKDLNLKAQKFNVEEALQIIKDSKKCLESTHTMVAGGQEIILKERQYEIFEYGTNTIVIGGYLTTKGKEALKDIVKLQEMEFNFAA